MSENKTSVVVVRITSAQRDQLQRAAQKAGLKEVELVRQIILEYLEAWKKEK